VKYFLENNHIWLFKESFSPCELTDTASVDIRARI